MLSDETFAVFFSSMSDKQIPSLEALGHACIGHLQQWFVERHKLWTLANTFFEAEIEHGKASATFSQVDIPGTISRESDLVCAILGQYLFSALVVPAQISSSVFSVPALQ